MHRLSKIIVVVMVLISTKLPAQHVISLFSNNNNDRINKSLVRDQVSSLKDQPARKPDSIKPMFQTLPFIRPIPEGMYTKNLAFSAARNCNLKRRRISASDSVWVHWHTAICLKEKVFIKRSYYEIIIERPKYLRSLLKQKGIARQ